MGSRKLDIAAGIACLAFGAVYVVSLLGPVKDQFDDEVYKRIWLLTVFSLCYAMSFMLHIVAKGMFFKIGSAISLSIFSANLTNEIWGNGENWSVWGKWLIVLVLIKMFLIVVIVEKIKIKYGYGKGSSNK